MTTKFNIDHDSGRPYVLVAKDGSRVKVSLFTSGGYDASILEGSRQGEIATGMFLGCLGDGWDRFWANKERYGFEGWARQLADRSIIQAEFDSEMPWELDGVEYRIERPWTRTEFDGYIVERHDDEDGKMLVVRKPYGQIVMEYEHPLESDWDDHSDWAAYVIAHFESNQD